MKMKFAHYALATLLLAGVALGTGALANTASKVIQKSAGAPSGCTNLSATSAEPNDDGSADVTIKFTAPTKYVNDWGDAYTGLTELTKIVISTRDSNWDFVDLKTIENPTIGGEYEVVLENQSSGTHTYYVTCFNSMSESTVEDNWYGRESVYAYVGYDTPASVTNISVKNNYPEVILSWDPVTTGYNGGFIKPEEITYTVTRTAGSESTEVATAISECSFTDNLDFDTLTTVTYHVVANNSIGSSYSVSSSSIAVGPSLSLPFYDSFTDGAATQVWTTDSSDGGVSTTTYISSWGKYLPFGDYLDNSFDNDNGALMFSCSKNSWSDGTDEWASAQTAAISLADASAPALTFYSYNYGLATNSMSVDVIVAQNGQESVVRTINYTSEEQGWEFVSIPLTAYVGGDITLKFKATCNSLQNGFAAFDCIRIDNQQEKDLKVNGFSVPTSMISGKSYTATVTVSNIGAVDVENYSVVLTRDGEEFATKECQALAAGENATVTIEFAADNSFEEVTELAARIDCADDQDLSNNKSSSVTVAVTLAATPPVTDLKVEYVEPQEMHLSWSEPEYQLPTSTTRVESFEAYDNMSFTFGDWTLFEDDFHYISDWSNYGINYSDSWSKLSYCVLDESQLEVSDTSKWYGRAHSGNKYIASFAPLWGDRADWLVSPELSGNEQTLEFYAASNTYPTSKYGEEEDMRDRIMVYVSFTGTKQSDFTMKVLTDADDKSAGYPLENALVNERDDYEKISVTLPEGAKYFAVVVVTGSSSDSVVFFDDFSFEIAQDAIQAELLGYNVYDGATKLNEELVNETSYIHKVEYSSEHSYTVEAIYNVGEAIRSNTVEITAPETSAVKEVTADNSRITVLRGAIYIESERATVMNVNGQIIANTSGNATVYVAPGIYMIKTTGKTFKVIV